MRVDGEIGQSAEIRLKRDYKLVTNSATHEKYIERRTSKELKELRGISTEELGDNRFIGYIHGYHRGTGHKPKIIDFCIGYPPGSHLFSDEDKVEIPERAVAKYLPTEHQPEELE